MREQFLVEVGDGAQVKDLAEMNRVFQAWLETVYHRTVHSETGEAPAARWEKASPAERAVPEPGLLREAFLWSERRRADKTALVRMHGNVYQVDAWLAGQYIELVFDPFDLDRVEVRAGGKPAGTAVPFTVGRHRHPKTRLPDGQPRTEPAPTGIDYLAALGDGHDAALRDQVSYRFLVNGPAGEPGSRGNRKTGKAAKQAAVADSPRETLALARTAAGAVRSLNHATLGGDGLGQPADAYELIGELSLAAAGLPQLLAQISRWLASALESGRLGCDDGADPAAAVGGARLSLSGARATAAALAAALGQAQQQIAAVHGGPAPEEEGGERP